MTVRFGNMTGAFCLSAPFGWLYYGPMTLRWRRVMVPGLPQNHFLILALMPVTLFVPGPTRVLYNGLITR